VKRQPRISKRLLLVDDEPGIRATLPLVLERHGFHVSAAATVQEALELIRTTGLDLLICDLNIQQDRDGYAVIREMRSANPRSVIVVLTGYPDFESAVEGIRSRVDDYLMKPADVDFLVNLLADKLAVREQHL
jgi:DNA-binding NtrC family response regulator